VKGNEPKGGPQRTLAFLGKRGRFFEQKSGNQEKIIFGEGSSVKKGDRRTRDGVRGGIWRFKRNMHRGTDPSASSQSTAELGWGKRNEKR